MPLPTLSHQTSALPDELLLLIAEQLSAAELLTFLRINTTYYRVGFGLLLRAHNSVDLLSNLAGSPAPGLNPCLFNADYTSHFHSVTVKTHSSTLCIDAVIPKLPTVHILRLQLSYDAPCFCGRGLIHSNADYREGSDEDITQGPGCYFKEETICPLLSLPSSRTLVITEAATFEAPAIEDVLPPETSRNINSVVLFLNHSQIITCSAAYANFGLYEDDNEDDQDTDWPTRMDKMARLVPENALSFTVVYPATTEQTGWTDGRQWSEDTQYEHSLSLPALGLVRGIFDLCDDIGHDPNVADVLSPYLDTFTVVFPDGVLTSECSHFLQDQIADNHKQYQPKTMPAVRILSMSQFMDHEDYAGVMNGKEKANWSQRATLPHYELSIAEIQRCIDKSKARKQRYAS